MKKMKRSKLITYAASGIGPNLLMIFVTAHLLTAIYPAGLGSDSVGAWSIHGTTIVSVGLIGVLWTIARIIDGLVDIPLSNVLENIKSKYGRRKTAIAISFIPMVVSYLLLWWQPFALSNTTLNTWWVFIFVLIFFVSYTMTLIAYYASFSEVVNTESERAQLSSYKAFFDVIGYSIAYALIPVILGSGINIREIVFALSPLFLTMLIPLFLLKEEPTNEVTEKVTLKSQLKAAAGNKMFLKYLIVLAAIHFGLQLYLAAQTEIATGVMQLDKGWKVAILNSAAFAPVPLMLILFNYIRKQKGIKFAYRTAMVAFGVGILIFTFGSGLLFKGNDNWTIRLAIGVLGALTASFAIGPLFSFSYLMPSQIAAVEMKETGKNNTSMFFAVQGLVTQVAAAFSTGIVFVGIKSINVPFLPAASTLGLEGTTGIYLIPLIVFIFMVLAFAVGKLLPNTFEANLDNKQTIHQRNLVHMIIGFVYSAGLINLFIPFLHLYEAYKEEGKKMRVWLHIIIAIVSLGLYVVLMYAIHAKRYSHVTTKKRTILFIVLSILFVGFIVNPFILQNDYNQKIKQNLKA